MSLLTVYNAAREALKDHIEAAWDVTTLATNSQEGAVTAADLPIARIMVDGAIEITTSTVTDDDAVIPFTISALWPRPATPNDLEHYVMSRAEELRARIADDFQLGGVGTDCRVGSIALELPGIDPQNDWVGVTLSVPCQVRYAR